MASGDNIESIEVLDTSFALIANNSKDHTTNNETALDMDDKDRLSANKYTGQDATLFLQRTPSTMPRSKSDRERDKDRKIGHRRVGVGGEITYKKIQTTQIMGSIQLGIQHAVGGLASKPERDLLMQDFMTVETTNFPSEGSNHTPAHHYSEFKYKNYAPIAFRYFRDLFGIQPDDFLMSMCSSPLRELTNPGASGSIFYLTNDDEFIIKTVQHKEGEFLQKLLAGYYMNLNQNPRTLLPKFFGLYCYQCNSKNVRLVVMNNLLPSAVILHQKYDLKGSTYKRKASKTEKAKRSPTYKDLDFMEHHSEGILMEADTYAALVKTIQRDCRVLESFKIMDYSLLVGVHNMDQAQKEKLEKRSQSNIDSTIDDDDMTNNGAGAMADASLAMLHGERDREREDRVGAAALNRSKSINRQRLVAHSTAMESIQAESEPIDEDDDSPPGGIPARNSRGERLLLYIGIIDILQSYRLKKKLEHSWKSLIHDGDTVSVHRPSFYAQRFQEFMAKRVFKKIPSLDLPEIKGNHRKFRTLVTSYIALKHSPSKRKSLSKQLRPLEEIDSATNGQGQSNSSQHCSKTVSPTDPKSTGAPPAYPPSSYPPSSSTPPPIYAPPISVATMIDATANAPIITAAPALLQAAAPVYVQSAVAGSAATGYPAVLVGRPNATAEASGKVKVPPPVPPRGAPKTKRGSTAGAGQAAAAKGGVGGVVPSCCSTPPPPFTDVLAEKHHHNHHRSSSSTGDEESATAPPVRGSRVSSSAHHHHSQHSHSTVMENRGGSVRGYREDVVSVTDIRLESRPDNKSSLSVESGSSSGVGCGTVGSSSGGHSSSHSGRTTGAPLAWTPPASVEGSTPTWTEGTPSFTESSSSGDVGCPTTPLRHDGTTGGMAQQHQQQQPQQQQGPPSHHTGHVHHQQHKKTVEHAITCLTSEMEQLKNRVVTDYN